MIHQNDSKIEVIPGVGKHATVIINYDKENDKRPFSMIGPLKHKDSYNHVTYKDPYDLITDLTKTSQNIFTELKNNRDKDTNFITMLTWKEVSQAKAKAIQRGLKELIKAKIICEAKEIKEYSYFPQKHTYLFNPYLIKCNEYMKAKNFWKAFTGFMEEKL